MKKATFKKFGALALGAVLVFGIGCANGGGNGNAEKGGSFANSADFFAMSAASGVSFLNATEQTSKPRAARRAKNATYDVRATADPATARPEEYSDEKVLEIKNCLTMFESIAAGGITAETTANEDGLAEYVKYEFKMAVTFDGESAVMYYNETEPTALREVDYDEDDDDDDDDADERDEEEIETNSLITGVVVSGENVYETTGKREIEVEGDEREYSLELTLKKSDTTYVKFTYETETETDESEVSYECEIYENGVKVQETEIEIETENGKTEVKFEFENGGKGDGVEFKIVMRAEGKFDVSRKENGKNSYILAEKTESGYRFTYSNGYAENV